MPANLLRLRFARANCLIERASRHRAGKGGIGKTTLAILLADLVTVTGEPLAAFQVDDQRRLESFVPGVVTIAPDFELAMRQSRALTSPFAPLDMSNGLDPRSASNVDPSLTR